MLARGGMATVYEAIDLRLDRVVALKVMHAHLADDPDFVSRFEREAKAAARLTHPHVVGVYDQGKADGHVYLAMEYVPGRTLRDVMKQFGPLTSEQALVLLDPILEALEAAHGAGFVHRDIKPENVLISDDGRVKVADFGLARAVETSNASATQGMIIGTVAYLSPEQVERGDADGRSDVYAAGILLFEMITGQVPHAGDSPLSVAYKHVNSDVPAPSTVNAAIPADVDALVITATRRDPELRYQDAADFLADVRRVRTALPRPRPFTDARDTLVVDASMTQRIAAGARPPQPQHPAVETAPRRSRKGRWIALIVAIAVVLAALGGWLIAGSILTPKVPVPSIIGQTQSEATATLTAAGLTLAVSEQQFSETAAKDTIITSDPEPGGQVAQGGTVDAVISKGPERYSVPDVTGMS
ncbi:MAG: Stk1 family Ser/Thr kinase, partial [Actinomycetota bacterium]